jgi:predicted metal-binding membrane protein
MSQVAPQRRAALLLIGAAAVAWAVTVERMRGMDDGPGTDLGGLGWYLGVWVTMMAAMMLPSAAPAAEHVARLARRLPALLFTAGYLTVWSAFGFAAYGVFRVATSFDTGWVAWDEGGPYLAGGVIVAAGIYQWTAFKQRFLGRCRSPFPDTHAFRSGLRYGRDCVGSSGGLMVVLFALGVMSLLWMAVVAGAIFVEKVLPQGLRLTRLFAIALIVLGIWIALAPSSVPGLTQPDDAPAMQMEM